MYVVQSMLITFEPACQPSLASAGTPATPQCIFFRVVRSTGTPLRSPFRASSLYSRPSYQRSNEPRKRSQSGSHSRPHAPVGLNSPVRGYATALLCNARPVASGLALIRSKVKRIRHKPPTPRKRVPSIYSVSPPFVSDAKLFANRSALFANDAESAMIACSLL